MCSFYHLLIYNLLNSSNFWGSCRSKEKIISSHHINLLVVITYCSLPLVESLVENVLVSLTIVWRAQWQDAGCDPADHIEVPFVSVVEVLSEHRQGINCGILKSLATLCPWVYTSLTVSISRACLFPITPAKHSLQGDQVAGGNALSYVFCQQSWCQNSDLDCHW